MLQYNFEYGKVPEPYQRMSWWDMHPDRMPNDYGEPPPRKYENYVPMTAEEEHEYYLTRDADTPW